MRICEPRWIRPIVVLPGQTFPVVIRGCASASPEVRLEDGEVTCALEVLGSEPAASVRDVSVRCRVPDDVPTGLWTLMVEAGGHVARTPNCVQVFEGFPDHYAFVHTSDIHIWKSDGAGGMHDRTRALENMVAAINRLNPAFVINTGDLISRYRMNAADPLGPDEVRQQTIAVRQRLLALRVAMFVTPGNHDLAFSWSREAWARHMGFPPAGESDDYSFDFGRDHFAAMDASRRYCDQTGEATDNPFTPAQLEWIARDMAAAADGRRFLFFHYDYRTQLDALVERLGVEAVFYGHSNKRTFKGARSNGFIEGLLPGAHAYQVVHVGGKATRSELGPTWAELDA